MESKKVIFLIDYPFSKRDYNRYGIDIFMHNEISVEVWDLTTVLRPSFFQDHGIQEEFKWDGFKQFLNFQQVYNDFSSQVSEVVFISVIGYCLESLPIYRMLTKFGFCYCVYLATPVRNMAYRSRAMNFFYNLQRVTWRRCVSKCIRSIPYSWCGVKSADYLFVATDNCLDNRKLFPIDQKTEFIWAHILDYDVFLKNKSNSIKNEKIAVFLDEMVATHPDYSILGIKPLVSEEEYFKSLRSFFDFVEREYGLRVVIAAHPRSAYQENGSLFGGREITNGKTLEYIAKSSLVIAHSSSVVDMVALYSKPMVFITTDELANSLQQQLIEELSRKFRQPIINVDNKMIDSNICFDIDQDVYAKYIMKYIKKPVTPQKYFANIVIDTLFGNEKKYGLL